MNPFNFLLGSCRMTFAQSRAAEVMNICMLHSIVYKNVRKDTQDFIIELRLIEAKRLKKFCDEAGLPINEKRFLGLPALLYRYRHRYGLLLGLVLFFAVIFASQQFLWDIRIEGEMTLTEQEVKAALADCGLTVGAPLKKIKPEKVEGELLIKSDAISWVSVNMRGTVAHVEIREHIYPESKYKPEVANLIADCDGTIVGFEKVRGNIVVAIGDLVRKGELLVSGIYDSTTLGFNVTAAEGHVYARLSEDFSVCVPLEYTQKVYTGREYAEKYLIFYDKEIKFYSNCRNLPPKCDTIDVVEYLSFFEGGKLPFGIRTVRHREYRDETKTRTPEEAANEAFLLLRQQMDAAGATDILRKSFSWDINDTEYTLTCTVDYVKDIAIQVEIPYTKE